MTFFKEYFAFSDAQTDCLIKETMDWVVALWSLIRTGDLEVFQLGKFFTSAQGASYMSALHIASLV